MFATNDNAILPAVSSSSLSSSSPLVCPGTCGWWPAPSTALSGNLTTTQQLSADYNDSWASAIAPGDAEALMELIFAHCKPCPWGTRRPLSSAQSRRSSSGGGAVPFSFSLSPSSFCHPCEVPLSTIDYLFLVFHAILPFVVNHVAISYHSARNLKHSRRLFLLNLCQLCCAFAECSLAFVGSLLLFRPFGQLLIFGCARDGKLSEWYSLFNNPVLQYTRVLHCSSELVYPLYSLPFAIYALNLFTLLTVRSFLHFTFAAFFNIVLPGAPFYATLWALPLLALAHAVLSGVLHALFPFIALLVALLHLVVHLSAAVSADSAGTTTTIRQMCRLLLSNSCCCCSNRRHHHQRVPQHRLLPLWLPLLVHVALFAFALLTLFITFGAPNSGQWDEMIGTHFGDKWPIFLLILCALLPVPTLFFVLTIRLTAPGGIALASRRLSST